MNSYPAQTSSRQATAASTRSATRLVPFDQVISLRLSGEPNNIIRAVTNISVEGPFVASSIGYSLLAEPVAFRPVEPETPEIIVNGKSIPPQALIRVIYNTDDDGTKRCSGRVEIFGSPGAIVRLTVELDGQPVPPSQPDPEVEVKAKPEVTTEPTGEYQLPDDGHLILQQPVFEVESFTNGVMRVEDLTHQLDGGVVEFTPATTESFLFGIRLPVVGRSRIDIKGPADTTVEVIASPAVSSPESNNQVTFAENGTATFTYDKPLSPGSTAIIRKRGGNGISVETQSMLTLSKEILEINLALIPPEFLRRGFRLKNSLARRLEKGVTPPVSELENPFEPCGVSELSFLYTITDQGSGRELQNEPIHNIAGLGIANGDRPFRTFPKPIIFRPRSVVQFEVREISGGPGTLFFVLQGYKVIGAGGRGGAHADAL